MSNLSPRFCFGDFELDVANYELRCQGQPVHVERQPMDLLILLLEGRQRLVSRAEIAERLWGADVFTDVETGVNTAVRKIRRALKDSTDPPAFIETVPRKGYRFIADVRVIIDGRAQEKPAQVIVAVLPFENLGAGVEREYLADGLTEETILSLGRIGRDDFHVIGRRSVMVYKGGNKNLATIGRELGATYVVENTLRGENELLRITSRLIRTRDQTQLWAASYDSEPGSILAFQRELSVTIAEEIRLRLSPERLTALARRQTQNAEAYDLYLHGRHFWNQSTPPTTKRALEYFTRATQLDSQYALAWAGLADAYSASPVNGDAPPLSVRNPARAAVAHAVSSDPGLAEVQTSVGFLKFWLEWDWMEAEKAYRQALTLDPTYPLAHRMLGIVLSHMGRHEPARESIRRARELDPLYAMHHALSAQIAFAARDYSAAVEFATQATVIDPHFWIGYFQLAQVHVQLRNTDLAVDALSHAGKLSGGNTKVIALRSYLLSQVGQIDEARQGLHTLEAISRERYVPPYAMALIHAGLNQPDDALDCLERAYDQRDVHLIFLPIDPKWDFLRSHARFASIMDRCGFLAN